MARVVVFHTSDLHDKLTPKTADRLSELKASVPGSLMLDSGDALRAGNIYWLPTEPIIDLMNSVPYDAMTMGNREYHFLHAGLVAKTSRADFAVLSANLRAAKPPGRPDPSWISPSEVFDRGGVRVGVIGLTVPCITERMVVKKLAQYYFARPIDAAKEVVPELRERCDVLIALTHLAAGADRSLAESVPGIDVILAAHSHTVAEPERVGSTTILRHGAHAQYVGKVTLDVEEHRVTVADDLIPLTKA